MSSKYGVSGFRDLGCYIFEEKKKSKYDFFWKNSNFWDLAPNGYPMKAHDLLILKMAVNF